MLTNRDAMTGESQHEDLSRLHQAEGGSDRSFGFVFAVVFSIIGCWPILDGNSPYWWVLAIAAALGVVAAAAPQKLAPGNRLWTRFGIALGKIVAPIMLAIVFYLVVTPTALIMRLIGRDLLSLSFDGKKTTYWVRREPPPPGSMRNQF